MTPRRYRQIRSLYEAALEQSGEERERLIRDGARNDHDLQDEVRHLLEIRSVSPDFLVKPVDSERQAWKRSAIFSSLLSGYRLPEDLARKAIGRLGFLGLIAAFMAPLAYLSELYLQPERVILPGRLPLPLISAVILFVGGLIVFSLTRTGTLLPMQVLNAGLIYEVLGALTIAVSEHGLPWPADQPIRGISWISLWISLFAVTIPAGYGKSVLSAICAGLMAPVGFAIAATLNGNQMPGWNRLSILFLPVLATVLLSIPVSRYIHGLGAVVTRERELGSYRLVERIGAGGMGEVWRAEHRMLARSAAVKLIQPEMAAGHAGPSYDKLRQRFEREARATAALRSPHTVALYDYGVSEGGQFYYAMELLEGVDMEVLVSAYGPQPPSRVVFLLRQVCKSLSEAHERGLIHRDIKPRNLFVCRLGLESDFVKVLDFGLVKPQKEAKRTESQLTADGLLLGTPGYMSPEMALGKPADPRSDLYSLGCVAYWLLSGKMLFERETALSMVLAHTQTAPDRLSKRANQPIPLPLENLVLRCLEKDPARRPQSAKEVYDLLGACDARTEWTAEDAAQWWRSNSPPSGATYSE